MSGDATEHEMIERLVDATRRAADRVQEICRAMMLNAPIAPRSLVELRHWLSQAAGSAYQLGHAQSNPSFFGLRDQLDEIAKHVTAAALSRSPKSGMVLASIGAVLDVLWRKADRIAKARSVPRADVLAALDVRQKALVH